MKKKRNRVQMFFPFVAVINEVQVVENPAFG